jgi:hypothetical protein
VSRGRSNACNSLAPRIDKNLWNPVVKRCRFVRLRIVSGYVFYLSTAGRVHAVEPETVGSFTPLVTGGATKSITSIQSPSKPLDASSSPSYVPSPLILLNYIRRVEVPRAPTAQCSQRPCLASLALCRKCPS